LITDPPPHTAPLLRSEARRLAAGADGKEADRLLDAFNRELDALPKLDEAATKALLLDLASLRDEGRDADAIAIRNQIVEGWMGFAVWMANSFKQRIDFLDAVQIASTALLKAVDTINPTTLTGSKQTFDPDRAHPTPTFTAFAYRCVKNALLQHLDFHKPVRIRFSKRNCPTWQREPVHLMDPVIDEHLQETDESIFSTIADPKVLTPEELLLREENHTLVEQLMANATPPLTARERQAFTLKRGLADGIERSNSEVAILMNTTPTHVRTLSDTAFRKVKAGITARHAATDTTRRHLCCQRTR
jgi:RNA polymerase sigma factor (sigma-70 family)